MLYYLGQWVKLLIGIGVLCFLLFYDVWLKKHYNCSAVSLFGVAVGALDCFLWFAVSSYDGIVWHIALFVIAAVVFFFLYAFNFEQSGSLLQGLLMTLWQILAGLLILGFFICLKQERKNKK